MDKPEKEVKSKGEIRRFFNTKVVKSEKVVIGGKTMYMTIDKIDDSGKEVKRKKNTNSKPTLIVSGSYARQIASYIEVSAVIEPFFVLKSLAFIKKSI